MRSRRALWLPATTAVLLTSAAARAQPAVYYGGRVISNVEIVEVSWTNAVDPGYAAELAGFYQAIVGSSFIDWMSEYDTIGKTGYVDLLPGSNQHVGRGTFGGSFVIAPANANMVLADTDIQTELAAQLAASALPPPKLDAAGNVDSLYMIDFPAGYSMSIMGLEACSQFGAYHGTMTYAGLSVPYGVHPDCGASFDTETVYHSHELAESITDMEVGLAVQLAATVRPIAWVTVADTAWDSQEIGDLCVGSNDMVAGYAVQKIWSNFANACVAQIPICDGVAAPPQCRPCIAFDSGAACSGATPACATAGPSAGQCVTCTAAAPAACAGATPVCDDATYTCVGCVTSADCAAPGAPVCDAPTQTCRACAADAECATGVCDVTMDAELGQCVACNADADCAADQRCDAHACVAVPPPTTSSSVASSSSSSGDGSGGSGSGGAGSGGAGGHGAAPATPAGCGCRTAAGGADETAGWLVLALAAIGARRRRERARMARK